MRANYYRKRQSEPARKTSNVANVTGEDDWTSITDQSDRKRVQNRIAQRNYRRRLKSHIEALEHNAAANATAQSSSSLSTQAKNCKSRHHREGNVHTCTKCKSINEGGSSASRHVQTSSSFNAQQKEKSPQAAEQMRITPLPSPLEQLTTSAEQAITPEAFMDSFCMPLISNKYPSYGDTFALSTEGSDFAMQSGQMEYDSSFTTRPAGRTRGSRHCSEWNPVLDSLHNSGQRDESFAMTECPWHARGVSDGKLFNPASSSSSSKNAPLHDTSLVDNVATISNWNEIAARALSNSRYHPHSHSSPPKLGDCPPEKTIPTKVVASSMETCHENKDRDRDRRCGGDRDCSLTPDSMELLPEAATLNERLEYILECVQSAGFENFDTVVSKYYTGDMSGSPVVANAQRISRKRQLPRIITDLRENTHSWTDWEAQGYREEILKSAESILISEYNAGIRSQQFHDEIAALIPRDDTPGESSCLASPPSSASMHPTSATTPVVRSEGASANNNENEIPQAIHRMKNNFQKSLPNLWALATALTLDGLSFRQQDKSNLVLAAISILCISRQMSPSQLRLWINHCLDEPTSNRTKKHK